MDADVDEVTELLARRRAVLAALADGPLTKRELESALDVSRSTVDRAVRSLESADFVERSNGGVSLTLLGRIAMDGFASFADGLEGLGQAAPLLGQIDRDEPLPFALFEDAMIVLANRASPHRPIVALTQFLDEASEVHTIATGLLPEYVDAYHEQVVEKGMTVEFVVRTEVLNDLLATFWDPVDEIIETGRSRLYEIPDDPPYSIKIGDTGDGEEVAIVFYGEHGVNGFIRSDRPEAVRWAWEEYERIRENAELVAPSS